MIRRTKPKVMRANGEKRASADPARIVRTKGICGGDARIQGTRMPVWVLEAARQEGSSARQIAEFYDGLSVDDVTAALKYAARHRDEINAQIADNTD